MQNNTEECLEKGIPLLFLSRVIMFCIGEFVFYFTNILVIRNKEANIIVKVNSKTLACTVKDSLNQQIVEVAEKKNLKKSQIMRLALQEYLEEGSNRPAEAALLVQMCNQLEAIKESVEQDQYRQITKTLDSIIKLKG